MNQMYNKYINNILTIYINSIINKKKIFFMTENYTH